MHPDTGVVIPSLAKCAKDVVKVNCNGAVMQFSKGDFSIISGGPSLSE